MQLPVTTPSLALRCQDTVGAGSGSARPLVPAFAQRLGHAEAPQVGMWVCSGSTTVAEICAGSGVDWLLIDSEHAPLSLPLIQDLLRAVAAYPATPVVRVASLDRVAITQYLDLGAANLVVPMVDTAEQAAAAVAATRYPPAGIRGVGSALSRGARWNRVPDYLSRADSDYVSLFVQVESATAVANAAHIAATDGVDGVFIGPSDLAASMGLIGQQTHPQVLKAVYATMEAVKAAGKFVGVNAFDHAQAAAYLEAGADFILVGADVTLLARGSEDLARRFRP